MANSDPTRPQGQESRLLSFAGMAALGTCVFVSGGAVMIYEFLAVRFLQRYYGSSLDVWASEIAICLAGLAVGYALGGWLADRYRSERVLGAALLVSGILGFFMERLAVWIAERLLAVDVALSWHPLLAAGFSTFLPFLALGTVLPQAIRLHVRRIERVGTSAGRMATLSTAGSIAGALMTAHVLLPRWGVRETLYGMSLVLAALGGAVVAVGFLSSWRRKAGVMMLLLFLVPGASAGADVIFENYSAYHHILVEDSGDERALRFDSDMQSTMSLTDPYAGGFEYTDFFHVPLVFDPTVRHVLFIGLGGGTGPKGFLRYYPTVQVEVAEIDPMVEQVARQFFAVPDDPRLRIAIADGRGYLQRSRGPFGAIILDAYGSGPHGAYIPYHLATVEFFRIAWARIENGGCLVYNVMGTYGGLNDDVVRNMMTTLSSIFQAVYAFRARTSENTVFVAVKISPEELQPDGTENGLAWPNGPWLQHPLNDSQLRELAATFKSSFTVTFPNLETRLTQFSPVQTRPAAGMVLTDNYAPVDIAPSLRR